MTSFLDIIADNDFVVGGLFARHANRSLVLDYADLARFACVSRACRAIARRVYRAWMAADLVQRGFKPLAAGEEPRPYPCVFHAMENMLYAQLGANHGSLAGILWDDSDYQCVYHGDGWVREAWDGHLSSSLPNALHWEVVGTALDPPSQGTISWHDAPPTWSRPGERNLIWCNCHRCWRAFPAPGAS